ncbi:MAG: DUF4190 domain-containing protein [Sphaerochaetaceae bacterium]|nr:DUF4190 domain-containing protein [Sphaerochaetaceae bacterium]
MDNYDDNSHPYDEEKCVKKTTSDDASSVVLILGIISIVSMFSWIFSFVGLILGIIALVKGTKIRHNSSAAMAGWVLSIISISIFALGVIFFIGFLMPPFWCFI